MEQIAQTQGLFAVFVAVGVGDAPAGGAEGCAFFGQAVLFQPVLHLVPRHGDGGLIRELQVFGADGDAALLDGVHFTGQMIQVDDHARAQHAGHVRVQDAGGQQVQDELALLGHNGVACVVAALIAGDDIGVFSQQVDDAPFAFIAPIDSSYCSQHNFLFTFFFIVHDGLHFGGQTVDADKAGGVALLVVAACGKGGDVLAVVVVLLQPWDDDGCIQTAGIRQNDLFDLGYKKQPPFIPTLLLFHFPLAILDCSCYYTSRRRMCKKYPAHGHDMILI